MSAQSPLALRRGFEFLPMPGGGGPVKARFRCVECGETLDLTTTSGIREHPDYLTRRAGKKGWKAHPNRKNDCFCPKCAGPQRKPQQEIKEMAEPAQKPLSIVPKAPTNEQRLAIRGHLDKSFDDKAGCYLDGLSDQRIAELVGVPRIIVEQIRDAGWGPVRVSPELAALRSDIASMKARVDDYQKAGVKLASDLAALSSRVEKVVV